MIRFRMVARDFNSNPTQYRCWVVPGQPDFDGYFYTGLKSGPDDFTDVSTYAILDDNAIVDFNLPDPTQWVATDDRLNVSFPIRKLLPHPLEDSHLVILDGYIYMFGGKVTDKIFRADLNNPADWVDTGAVLPSILYGAEIAVIDGYIYLFGGNDGEELVFGEGALDTIYTAPVSDPLTWTDQGSHLPRELMWSNFGMANGQLYLFGGLETNHASDVIFTAPQSDPLNWSESGAFLPHEVYGSMFGQVDGYWMIFGGQTLPDTPINLIMSAPVSSPLTWTITGLLPHSCSQGQFVNIGDDGYIFGPMVGVTTTYTSILRANLRVDPNSWIEMPFVIPGCISHSQMAIISDRVWLFGGSGLTAIFACNQIRKYSVLAPKAINYGQITRTNVATSDNLNNPYEALSIPWWYTDFNFTNRP